ncbi:hypothetical protein NITMOv2_4756 [Nitrospira moscoviensis]|uniref:Uncharacterized protein n=1 Tax=Nitrospira moscoviensis TaxID=42253 RepID=A0A0K2GJJ8_NITMO|nr:hypothetical protein NITMOv2_4756 [Nitrospira moscoviensis]
MPDGASMTSPRQVKWIHTLRQRILIGILPPRTLVETAIRTTLRKRRFRIINPVLTPR